jgi:hypothetical protein
VAQAGAGGERAGGGWGLNSQDVCGIVAGFEVGAEAAVTRDGGAGSGDIRPSTSSGKGALAMEGRPSDRYGLLLGDEGEDPRVVGATAVVVESGSVRVAAALGSKGVLPPALRARFAMPWTYTLPFHDVNTSAWPNQRCGMDMSMCMEARLVSVTPPPASAKWAIKLLQALLVASGTVCLSKPSSRHTCDNERYTKDVCNV